MPTDVDSLISLNGLEFDIYKVTYGADDAYGDPTPTWTKQDDAEKVWLQSTRSIRFRQDQIMRGVAGNIDDFDYVGYLLSTSVIQAGDYIARDSVKYSVEAIEDLLLFGEVSHKEALLKLIEEGE